MDAITLLQLKMAAKSATQGEWRFAKSGGFDALVKVTVDSAYKSHADVVLCKLFRSKWRGELQTACDAIFIATASPANVTALIEKLEHAQSSHDSTPKIAETAETTAVRDALAERQRQQSVKGYTIQQDDTYTCGELAAAAISYIEPMEAESYWPADWSEDDFKPTDDRRNLVKAAALLIAEIERIDRMENQQ